MKDPRLRRARHLALLLAALASCTAVPSSAADEIVAVAVFDFEAAPDLGVAGADLAALLSAGLSEQQSLILVERSELEKVLAELELDLSGTMSAEGAGKVGHLAGADALATGRLFRTAGGLYLSAKIIAVATGRSFAALEKLDAADAADAAAGKLAGVISERISENRQAFLPAAESEEERLARLRRLVAGKALPSVFVRIPETHLSRAVPDPAAQTEIQKTLQELGFRIVDKESAADAVVTGEAFSELGMRHANLVTCRARLELVVRKDARSPEIRVARETAAAADLGENVAAKTALERAGRRSAERVVALLIE